MTDFESEVKNRIEVQGADSALRLAAHNFLQRSIELRYSYNFSWMGRPIIQYPQDMVAVQELVWKVRPDLIIETGIAHGGSLILSASLLALLDYCEAVENGVVLDPMKPKRRVLGVDVDIRPHNREAIRRHPMYGRIDMIEGSSVDSSIVDQVRQKASMYECVMVFLDSNHTHEHVLAELEAYAPLVTPGSYCVVFDTVVEELPDSFYDDRSWDSRNNPKTAVRAYLEESRDFEVDRVIDEKLQITVAREGYLRRRLD